MTHKVSFRRFWQSGPNMYWEEPDDVQGKVETPYYNAMQHAVAAFLQTLKPEDIIAVCEHQQGPTTVYYRKQA